MRNTGMVLGGFMVTRSCIESVEYRKYCQIQSLLASFKDRRWCRWMEKLPAMMKASSCARDRVGTGAKYYGICPVTSTNFRKM